MSVNHLKQDQIKTREDYKKIKEDKQKKVAVERRIRVRLIPIWLRIILLIVLVIGSTVAGAAVGYGVIGDGKPMDVFKESTWTHVRDLVEKEKSK